MSVKRGEAEPKRLASKKDNSQRRHRGRTYGGKRAGGKNQWETRRKGIREELREKIRQEVSGSRDISDSELYERIDRLIMERGEEDYLPLKERIELRAALFNSFRKLDILQQLIDDPDITEVMINGPRRVFVEIGRAHV